MDILFRTLIIFFGYFYPAYKCFSALDSRMIKTEELHSWCRYWIIMAMFAGLERVADTFISWVPFYSGGKLAFIIYLWHPDTKGTEYIYETYMKPLFSQHSKHVDHSWFYFKNQVIEVSKDLCNRALLSIELKCSKTVNQHATSLPAKIQPFQPQLQQLSAFRQAYVGGAIRPGSQPAHISTCQSLQSQQLGVVKKAQHQKDSAVATSSDDKEDTDFELLHSSDIPLGVDTSKSHDDKNIPVSIAAEDGNKASGHMQGFRFLRWYQGLISR